MMEIEIVYTVSAPTVMEVEENLNKFLTLAQAEYGQPEVRRKK